jgi:hypothetical protein
MQYHHEEFEYDWKKNFTLPRQQLENASDNMNSVCATSKCFFYVILGCPI